MKKLYTYINLSNNFTFLLVVFLASTLFDSFSQNKSEVNHAFHKAFVISLEGGVTLPQTDYQTNKMGLATRLTGEYFFKTNSIHLFGLKVKLGYDQLQGEDTRGTISSKDGIRNIPPKFTTGIFTGGIGATYSISIGEKFFPYISGGITNLWFDPRDDQNNAAEYNAANKYEKSTIGYSIEAGFRYLVSDKVSINVSVNPYIPQSDYLDDVAAAYSNDAYTTVLVGISYSPFIDNDSDKDGIKGKEDICPDEAEDYDGYEDEDGCPELDNDGDGILDAVDKCPNEAEDKDGYEDEDGCPELDNDGDGIPDAADKCPDEAEDKDGISDEDGCPDAIKQTGQNHFILSADDIFQPNSYQIMYEAKELLNGIIKKMQESQVKKWRIEGHMDSSGETRKLRTLSLDRAKAILEYLIYFGNFNREDFQVFGMGDKFPVEYNDTEEGRSKNRRIEIIEINEN